MIGASIFYRVFANASAYVLVVHDEDARFDSLSNHGSHFLGGQLEGAVTDDGDDTS
jgi:hypothetical protein